jgi:hypothetical protein
MKHRVVYGGEAEMTVIFTTVSRMFAAIPPQRELSCVETDDREI